MLCCHRVKKLVVKVTVAILVVVGAAPAAVADTVTVAAAGDIARPNSPGTPQRQTADLITSVIKPAKVLVLGDEQYEHGEYTQFLRSYDPTWGAFKAISAPVPGNHEYETPNAAGYFEYFNTVLSQYGATAQDPGKGYYSFDLGDWHIVAINSNCSIPGISCSAERSWLKQDLTADNHVCELAFSHHPSKSFATALAARGVEMVLVGHRHKYERWEGVYGLNLRELIVGTGGRSINTPDPDADAGVKAFGVAKLTLNAGSYAWEFIDVAGKVRDSGSDACHV